MKQWFRIELFDENFMTCLPEQEVSHRLVMVERQYTSINRAWSAPNFPMEVLTYRKAEMLFDL